MKKILAIAFISAVMPILCSCNKDLDVPISIITGFCDVKDGQLVFNSSVRCTVSSDYTDGKWKEMDRVCVYIDVLEEIETGKSYRVRLDEYAMVPTQKSLRKSTSGEEVYGNDGIRYYQDWGYETSSHRLNMSYLLTYLTSSSKDHTLNLVFNDEKSNSDTLFLELHHNAFGESYDNEKYSASEITTGMGYMSFDISDCLPETEKDTLIVGISWDWFVSYDEQVLTREKEHHEVFKKLPLK